MRTPEELWREIETRCAPLASESLPRERARNRTLAAPLVAREDLPAADISALDGFALGEAPAPDAAVPVIGTLAAGVAPGARLEAGRALRIWTGAPIPAGADRVVAVEHTEPAGPDAVRVLKVPPPGAAIRRRAEIARAGDVLLEPGARLSAAALALAASQGVAALEVVGAPRVALLATGNEVVAPESRPAPGQLRDSHTTFLLAAGRELGLAFETLGIAADDPADLEHRLEPALAACDVVITCGGVSMGGADHAPAVLERLGCRTLVHGVAMQPGKPFLFACRDRTLVFGLPGNPASVMVGYRLFVRPALERLMGRTSAFWSDAFEVELAGPLPAAGDRDRFVPARSEPGSPRRRARPLVSRGSHDLGAVGRADLLLRSRAGRAARAAGDGAEAVPFP
jgi:molybdopterin molybdotransferase